MKLEFVDTVMLAHPFIKGFDRTNYCHSHAEQVEVSTGNITPEMMARTEADMVPEFVYYTTTFFIGLMIERKPRGDSFPLEL